MPFELKMTLGDVIRTVCKYPQAYLMNGTFGAALAFLEGYAYGGNLGNPGSSSSFFNPFREWLCKRFSWEDSGDDFWKRFLDSYADDQTALNEFARLWTEYEADPNQLVR